MVEALATGDEGAVKLSALRPTEPNLSERAQYEARVSGAYRVEYQAWAANLSCTVTDRQA